MDQRLLTTKLSPSPHLFQCAIAFSEVLRLASLQFGQRRDVADRAVKANPIIMVAGGWCFTCPATQSRWSMAAKLLLSPGRNSSA